MSIGLNISRFVTALAAEATSATEAITGSAGSETGSDVGTVIKQSFLDNGLWGKIIQGVKQYQAWHYAVFILFWLIIIFVPYFIGSFNFAIITSKRLYHDDIRKYGSKNAGLTNMYRVYGKKGAIYTLIGDSLKGMICAVIGYVFLGYTGAYAASFFCIIGHMFPIYYKFQGGKGVLTAAGALLLLDPPIFLILFAIFAIIALSTKYVSLASIMSMMLYPLILSRLRGNGAPVIFAFLIAASVVFMHRSNIKRLWNGEETKFSFKQKTNDAVESNGPARDKSDKKRR